MITATILLCTVCVCAQPTKYDQTLAARRAAYQATHAHARPKQPPNAYSEPIGVRKKEFVLESELPEPWLGSKQEKEMRGKCKYGKIWTGDGKSAYHLIWRTPDGSAYRATYENYERVLPGGRSIPDSRWEAHYSDNGNFAESCQVLEVDGLKDSAAAKAYCVEHWLKNSINGVEK